MILENVDIKKYCTLKVGGKFRYFTEVSDIEEIKKAYDFAEDKKIDTFLIGGGSNIVFSDGILDVLALKINILGFSVISENKEYIQIKVGAGENWDYFVERTVDMGLSGVEALSAIPGTVGATPVQNVGAYGQEVKNTIMSVEVFDIENKIVRNLSNNECKFEYRDSIFKNEAKGKYIIISVLFELYKNKVTVPDYPGVNKYFEEKNIKNPTLIQIRNAIIAIRSIKLPNPNIVPNVGSFFKNPIVKKEIALKLKNLYTEIPIFPIQNSGSNQNFGLGEEMVKISAGWLIENSGLKGKDFGHISTYKNNALVFVNDGNASFLDIENARDEIIKTVQEKFDIILETEPEFIK